MLDDCELDQLCIKACLSFVTTEERARFLHDLANVLTYLEDLKALGDLCSVKPLTSVHDKTMMWNDLRPDIIVSIATPKTVLGHAGPDTTEHDLFCVPKFVGQT